MAEISRTGLISHERLLEIIHYDPSTGIFTWKVTQRRARAGERCGGIDIHGYWRVTLDGRNYSAARVAWFYMTGSWPREEIDHINRVRNDNRFLNLREATRTQNNRNRNCRRDGARGTYFRRDRQKWVSRISVNGKRIELGSFDTECEAHEAFVEALRKLRGEFARAA